MHLKTKTVKGKKYKYMAKSIRLPSGKVVSLEKLYNPKEEFKFKTFFEDKEREENMKYALAKFKADHIFSEKEMRKIEEIRFNYKKLTKKLTKTSLKDLFDRFTANFTYESNALEGNSLTLKDVAVVMFENVSLKGKDLREIYETRNSRTVVELLIKNKLDISHENIIRIHKMLVRDTGIEAGYKRFPNVIIGRKMPTTPPEKVKEEMDKLIKWYKENKNGLHPLEIASIFHGKFEQIHPFEDGNGRVGRILLNVILIKNKYPPLIIRKSQRLAYLKALENFDHNHTDTIKRFILEKFKHTYNHFFEIYVKYL